MKKYGVTIITVALLVVCLVAILVLKLVNNESSQNSSETEEEETTTESNVIFPDAAISTVTKIHMKSSTAEYVLELSDDEWICTNADIEPVTNSVKSVLSTVLTLTPTRINNVESLEEYGFTDGTSDEYLEITYTSTTDNTEKTGKVYVGDYDYNQAARYVHIEGDGNNVAKLTNTSLKSLLFAKSEIINLKIFTYTSTDEPIYFIVKTEGEKTLELKYTYSEVSDEGEETWQWKVQYPIVRDCQNTNANEIIQAMQNLTLQTIAAENVAEEDLATYGLAPAGIEYYLYMKSEEGENTLYKIKVGQKDESNEYYYCTIEDAKDGVVDVYLVSTEYIYKTINPMDYVDTYLYLVDSDNVTTAEFTIDGESHVMHFLRETAETTDEETGETTEETVTTRFFDGKECADDDDYRIVVTDNLFTVPTEEQLALNEDDDVFNDILTANPYDAYNHLLGALYWCFTLNEIQIEEPTAEEKGEQIAIVKYTENDGTETTLELYKRDNTTAWAYIDGNYAGGYCRTTYLFGDDYANYDFAASLTGLKAVMALVP